MSEEVAIIGVGMLPIQKKMDHLRLEELVFLTAKAALDDAGIVRDDLDNVVLGASDELDGRSISSMLMATPAGALLKDEIKVTDSGLHALHLGYMRVASGLHNVTLVISWSKGSESSFENVMNMRWDPFIHRGMGLNHSTTTGLMASSYLTKYNVSPEIPAKVIVKNRMNGCLNSKAELHEEVTLEDVLSSESIAHPLKQLELAPISDGAVALVLASPEFIKDRELKNKPIWIKGIGWATDSYYLGQRDLSYSESLEIAAKQAYKMAGINNLHEIDVFEIEDQSAYHELIAYEALGLCEKGMAYELIEKGRTERNGDFPVNPSGGATCANPYFCAGLVRVAEAYLQVSNRADGHQILKAKTALAQGTNGFANQGNSVVILSQ
ncbi:thiolase family protein [Neobacillus niacini]|uniref:thiolase family protein n=1 Tax=Neobacillus niacini TaxID=86668 RepID=UPI002FFE8126